MQPRDIRSSVAAAIRHLMELRVAGVGNAGSHGGTSMRLFVMVKVSKNDAFLKVLEQALLGGEREIPTLNGASVSSCCVAGALVQPGTKSRFCATPRSSAIGWRWARAPSPRP